MTMRDYRVSDKIYCNKCGSLKSGDELDTLETLFVYDRNAVTICSDCYEEIEDNVTLCPECTVHVHMDDVSDSGRCPCCGFFEQEHTGSSWI
jgi:hypothetical protein